MSVLQSFACSAIREFKEQTGVAEAVASVYALAAVLTFLLRMGELSVLNVEKRSQTTEFWLV